MSTISLRISPDLAHVRVARLVAVAVGRRARLADEALDEVRLAIGEACGRAVALHGQEGYPESVVVELSDDDGLEVTVRDAVPLPAANGQSALVIAKDPAPDDDAEVTPKALSILVGLVEDLAVTTGPAGTAVRMRWQPGSGAR